MAQVSSPSGFSTRVRRVVSAVLIAGGAAALLQAQVPGRNVNMVSGDKWPDGDPYLQRQNEPSLAASTRNPLHLLGGSNDYRTVDLPGLPNGGETGDAWLGLYRSFDGGQRWKSTLLPGYPQDTSAVGTASVMKGYQAAADPVVRPGTNGLFYYSGIVFDRGVNGKSRVFVTRFIDNNNKETGDAIRYFGSTAVASTTGAAGDFIDKPWMAVDIPRPGAQTCNISTPGTATQQVPAGAVYLAYAVITTTRDSNGVTTSVNGRIMFTRSLNCGVTWSTPIAVSDPADPINQGVTIAVDPASGAVQLAWRRFGHSSTPDAVLTTRAMPGQQFPKPSLLRQTYSGRELGEVIKSLVGNRQKSTTPQPESPAIASDGNIAPFDQATTPASFRTNSYPTMAIDGGGRVYIAWSERGFRSGSGANTFDSTIVMTTGLAGANWNMPFPIDLYTGPGHQLMPSLAFAGGKLMLAYYDLREDISGLFQEFIDEAAVKALNLKRHTVDLRAAQATPAAIPSFGETGARSIRVSEYLVGSWPNSNIVQQLQFNPPNLPLFQLGQVPFLGDYIDIAPAPAFVQNSAGAWSYNTSSAAQPVFHTAWTDNRDVKPPEDGNWANYTPPTGTQSTSVFDPSKSVDPCVTGRAGMRNQNVYTAKLTTGLMVGSPGNSKPLSTNLPRAFVVFAQNTTDTFKWFRMTITAQPAGGRASFAQTGTTALLSVDVAVPGRSTVSKSVFATSTNPDAQIPVSVVQIASGGGAPVSNGLSGTVILNPDISNPDISNPDISNPDISNPDISNAEVYNPDISNPDISNPDISNPDISNPDISNPDISNALILNPDISNPDISNPDISNPDISNPDISNPDISNPDISNGAITDYTWTVTNEGNTTSNYDVNVLGTTVVPPGIKTQIVIHKTYTTPVSDGCTLKQQLQTVLVINVVNPQLLPSGSGDLTLWLEPGGKGRITLRVIDPNPNDAVVFNPVAPGTLVSPTVTSTAINTTDLSNPTAQPPSATPPTSAQTATALSVVANPITTAVSTSLGSVQVQLRRIVNGSPAAVAFAPVAVGIVTNPAGGHLDGTTTVATNSDGYAVFNGLSIDRAGQNYQLLFTASAAGALPVTSAPFTITPGGDPNRNYFAVTNTADAGVGSLRQAIINANNTPNGSGGPDVITFGFRVAGLQRIVPTTPLPVIVQPVVIDGTTQPGYAGVPLVFIEGTAPGSIEVPGLRIQASNSEVRGLGLVGFTASPAIQLFFSNNSLILGNFIGVTAAGLASRNNVGIEVHGTGHRIGGTLASERNVISGNGAGIYLTSDSGAAIVEGNYIGTNPAGTSALANDTGILADDTGSSRIGGPAATSRNVISGNTTAIRFTGTATAFQIRENFIGTNAGGLTALGNTAAGVVFTGNAINNVIENNTIAFNGGPGLRIVDGTGNSILLNSIHENAGLGIDLGSLGVTANDGAGEGDLIQNFPALTAAQNDASGTRVQGTLTSSANTSFEIRFFVSPACDPSGYGEGALQVGAITGVSTNVDGVLTFDQAFAPALPLGYVVTGTARNLATNRTSEFSNCVPVQQASPPLDALAGIGGTGGSPFAPIDCSASGAVTALTGEYTTAYAPLGALGDTHVWCSNAPAAPTGSVLKADDFPAGKWADYGSALTCPTGKVIQSVQAHVPTDNQMVTHVTITCTLPNGTAPESRGPSENIYTPAGPLVTAACPAGQVVVGIGGNSGLFIDRLELRCGVR